MAPYKFIIIIIIIIIVVFPGWNTAADWTTVIDQTEKKCNNLDTFL